MLRAVADTQKVIWYLYDDSRLSETARIAAFRGLARFDKSLPR